MKPALSRSPCLRPSKWIITGVVMLPRADGRFLGELLADAWEQKAPTRLARGLFLDP